MNDLFQLACLVFSNRDMAKKSDHTQRNMQKTQVIAVALTAQRPPKAKPAFLGQSGPGRPQGPRVPIQGQCYPVWTKGAPEGGLRSMCPLQTARALKGGVPQMPGSDGGPSAIDGFAIRRLKGPKAESGSA